MVYYNGTSPASNSVQPVKYSPDQTLIPLVSIFIITLHQYHVKKRAGLS